MQAKSMGRGRLIIAAVVGLMLSACGAPQAAQLFIREHTECPSLGYGSPQWTPDGARIIYNVYDVSSVDLREMNDKGKDDRLLVRDATTPLLSPDGTMVLFQRQSPNSIQAYDFYILDLETLQTRRVVEVGESASWSPDSQWVVYGLPPMAVARLRKTNVLTGETVQLTDGDDTYPLWSPDGQTIAFTSFRVGNAPAVYLMQADGSRVIQLDATQTQCPSSAISRGDWPHTWLPDGRSVAIRRACDWSTTLHVITTAGVEAVDLSALGQDIGEAQWSPDGKQLAFTGRDVKTFALSVADADGGNVRALRSDANSPRWSPDGQRIVFVGMDKARYPEIYIINADGSGLTQITQNPGAGRVCLH